MAFRDYELRCLLDEHGSELTFRSNSTAGTYDPATGTISGGATTDYTVKGHFAEFNMKERVAMEIVDGMRKCTLSTLDIWGNTIPEPEIGDTIIGQGDTVSIHRVQIFNSNGPVCYICWVKE